MDHSSIEKMLAASLQDGKLSRSEKKALRSVLALEADESHERDWLRNRAFKLAQQGLTDRDAKQSITWLEDVMGLLVSNERPGKPAATGDQAEVYFSPGNDCRHRIQELLRTATTSVDICVFTITDDRITDKIIDAHDRGVQVRVISDDDKALDKGSDLKRMERCRIPVAYDRTSNHMHHKFAVFDGSTALSGSYNWTRSASERNEENIIITGNVRIVDALQGEFTKMWKEFS